jgi:2-aminoadipate transaminase
MSDPALPADPPDGGFAQIELDTEFVDLGPGQPDPALLPASRLGQGLAEVTGRYGGDVLAYGANSGARIVRQAIVDQSQEDHSGLLTPDCVLVTAGATHAIDLLCTRLAQTGDVVLVQRASYHLALDLFASRGLHAVPVGPDHCLPDADELEDVTASLLSAGRKIAFFYLVPTFHNPTGRTLNVAERHALLGAARSLGLLLVEDDPYRQLYFGTQPPPPSLFALSGGRDVIAIGTLAKVLAPGLRVGWLIGAPALIEELAQDPLFASGGGIAHVSSAAALPMMVSGQLTRHVAWLREQYRCRRDALLSGLAPARADGAAWREPGGGFFAWVRLPPAVSAGDVERAGMANGVRFWRGVRNFAVPSADAASHIRLAFSMYGEQRLHQAGAALAEAIHEAARAGGGSSRKGIQS